MSGSLEDLRDSYKNLRQTKSSRHDLNGATFRKYRQLEMKTQGNIIQKLDTTDKKDLDLAELNNKYGLIESDLVYSLKKNKRWQFKSELVESLSELEPDVRLYETTSNNQKNRNLIATHNSNKENVVGVVKHSYGNLNSFLGAEKVNRLNRNEPTAVPKVKKVNRFKVNNLKKSKKNKTNQNERLVIGEENADQMNVYNVDTDYAKYMIEYGTRKDRLKYAGTDSRSNYNSHSNTVRSKHVKLIEHDDDDYECDYEDTSDSQESSEGVDSSIEINFADLLNKYADCLAEKEKVSKLKPKKAVPSLLEPKNKIFFIQNELVNKNKYQADNLVTKFSQPIPLRLEIDNESVESARLKEIFGSKYNEAYNVWPRHFNINISEDVKCELSAMFDIVIWLQFKEIPLSLHYDVSVCSNLNSESIFIENINDLCSWRVEEITTKATQFLTSLPIELFKTKPKSKEFGQGNTNLISSLPNIAGKQTTLEMESLKSELIEKCGSKAAPGVTRTNSIEVTTTRDENKSNFNVDNFIDERSYECVLCFDALDSLNDFVVIKTCSHCICKACMRDYTDSRLDNALANAGKFSCPCCDNQLELSLMINFASNGALLDTFLSMSVERVIFVLNNYKWCPSGNCNKVLRVDLITNPFGTASCLCGHQMCLKCNNAPHFPAKCSQVSNYYKELKSNNEFLAAASAPDDEQLVCKGKRCPNKNCNTIMEKVFGCNQMVCSVCKEVFCWNCMKLWADHLKLTGGTHNCTQNENNLFIDIEFVRHKQKVNKKSQRDAYTNSLMHRKKRTIKLSKKNFELATRLLNTIKVGEFVVDGQRDRTQAFLDEIVGFLMELHFVCEYSYVWMRDNSLASDAKSQILNIVNRCNVIIWQIERLLENGKGMKAIEKLEACQERGLHCIQLLKKLQN